MPVPVLLHVFPTFAVGGAQMRFAAIANHFGRRWHHAIIAMDGNIACRERLDPGLDVSFPEIAHIKGDTLGNVRLFRAVLRDMRPQTLITSNWGSIEWAMANALFPVTRHVHMEDGFGPEEREEQIRRRVLTRRLVLRRCTTLLPSRTLLAIATDIWRLPPVRLRYVPNGVDLTRFDATTRPETSEPVIGTVAALRPEKNLARLLHAVSLFSHRARLVIIGDGPERPMLESLAATLGIAERVTFAGHRADPRSAYDGFDIFALSSDTEQMPLTVLEAMASGLPVASTDVGDVAAMLSAENRPYVATLDRASLDSASLAAALAPLLRDSVLRRSVGAANRARAVAEYDQRGMFAAHAALYDGKKMDSGRPDGLDQTQPG